MYSILLAAKPPGSELTFPLMMTLMFVVMYFFMIRPQQKRAKEQKAFTDAMGTGEYIITTGGIHGTITRIYEDGTLQVEIGKGSFIKMERSAISYEQTAAYRKKNSPASEATSK
ncbi:MAG: preprotein translocase subunit YajC [Chitinophagia bacterium]|nr:preprotein translocase subunit YajC [Chitinophagia bacterium]